MEDIETPRQHALTGSEPPGAALLRASKSWGSTMKSLKTLGQHNEGQPNFRAAGTEGPQKIGAPR